MIHAQSFWKAAGAACHNPLILLLLGAVITNYLFPSTEEDSDAERVGAAGAVQDRISHARPGFASR